MADRDWKTPLIAAGSGLLGTLVGGLIGYYTNHGLQQQQFDREDHQRLVQAKSVAAIEQLRFKTAEGTLATMVESGGFRPPLADQLVTQVTGADQQLVVSYLDPRDMRAYANGRLCVDLLIRELPRDEPAEVTDGQVGLYRQWATCVTAADRAVGRVVSRRP
jgi:hypothetical protein